MLLPHKDKKKIKISNRFAIATWPTKGIAVANKASKTKLQIHKSSDRIDEVRLTLDTLKI